MASIREIRSLIASAVTVFVPPVFLTALAAGHVSLDGGIQAITALLGL